MRWALTKSRNLVSIRLLQQLGARKLITAAERYGFDTADFSPDLSLALGTHAMSPLDVATAMPCWRMGAIVSNPTSSQRIDDIAGEQVYEARPLTVCRDCDDRPAPAEAGELSMEEILAAQSKEKAELPAAPRVMEERINYIINSVLQDVITRGTGRRALVLERGDLAGKTGTTNGPMDAWFSGYNRDVVTTTWVGFDNYTPLGRREFGGTAALPTWINYMREALKNSPDEERVLPTGVVNVRIDPDTGMLAGSRQKKALSMSTFREEYVPPAGARWRRGRFCEPGHRRPGKRYILGVP